MWNFPGALSNILFFTVQYLQFYKLKANQQNNSDQETQIRTEEFCKFMKSFIVQKQNNAKTFVPLDFNQLYEQYWTPTKNWLLFMLL